jgi:hypothetical protein
MLTALCRMGCLWILYMSAPGVVDGLPSEEYTTLHCQRACHVPSDEKC